MTDRRLGISAAMNPGIGLVEFAGGLWAGNLALLARRGAALPAIHSMPSAARIRYRRQDHDPAASRL